MVIQLSSVFLKEWIDMKPKRTLSITETVTMNDYMTAPILYIDKKDMRKGMMQKTMKKYAAVFKDHPLTVLRPKTIKLPSLKPIEGKTIIVTNKKVEGFKEGPLSSLYQTESPKKHSLQQYISQTKAEGTSTRSEFLENLYNGFIQMYSEGNEYPESYLKMSESDFKWDLYTEHGLGNEKLPGITTPMGYIGSKNSLFCTHQEDGDNLSLNGHMGGAEKIWWGVPKIMEEEFKAILKEFPVIKQCSNFLRHKSHFINPAELRRRNIILYEVIQKPGDLVVTNGYHMGGNFGWNLNIAVNFSIDNELWTKLLITKSQVTNCLSDCKFNDKSLSLWNLQIKVSKCDKCNKSYDSDSGRKNHDAKCVGEEKMNKCLYCQKMVKNVIKHVETKHKDMDPPKLCTLCRIILPNTKQLRKHWTQKTKTNRYERKCNFCFKKFRIFQEAMSHQCDAS